MPRLGVAVILLLLQSNHAGAADKIRLAISTVDVGYLSGGVAERKKFFQSEGLDVEVIRMNAAVSVAAMMNGDVDYTMAFGSIIRSAIRGLPVKVVACLLDRSSHSLLSRPEFKSVPELRGKTLGVSSFGATADVVARLIFKQFGIDADRDLKIVALGAGSARFASLKEKIVDVVVVSPPADVEGKKMGFNILARAHDLFSFPNVGLGATVKKIKEKPDEVKRVIKALIRANRFIREDREGTIQILADWGRTGRDYAAASYDSSWSVFNLNGSIPEDGLQLVLDLAKKDARISRDIPLIEVSDLTLVREAQKELAAGSRNF
ncbi:MAG TPA: ABC transporter substrate-binding protein [Candidatus Binatia bacterium]